MMRNFLFRHFNSDSVKSFLCWLGGVVLEVGAYVCCSFVGGAIAACCVCIEMGLI